jgi:hypothetical protein
MRLSYCSGYRPRLSLVSLQAPKSVDLFEPICRLRQLLGALKATLRGLLLTRLGTDTLSPLA